jgi:ligand-binding sensor domain-containing protein/signal transduction histidine kinase
MGKAPSEGQRLRVRNVRVRFFIWGILLAALSVGVLAKTGIHTAPVFAQEPVPTVTPVPTSTPSPTPARPQPTPTKELLESDADVLSLLSPRERPPRDNDIRFDQISIEQGLSQSTVGCILQDHKGFMWFGTEDGLNKYNGYSFTSFRHDPEDPESISSNSIQCLHEDGRGMIWVGTIGGGLNKYDPQTAEFAHYVHEPANVYSLLSDQVLCIFEDKAGVLWVGTDAGLEQYDQATERFIHYQHNPHDAASLSEGSILSIDQDDKGNLWVATSRGGLDRLDAQDGTFRHYRYSPADPYSISSNKVTAVLEDSEGILWAGTGDGGLNRFDPEVGGFVHYAHDASDARSLSSNSVRDLYEDSSGVLWIATNGSGLERYDRDNDHFVHYRYDPFDPHSISHDDVCAVYEDRGGVLWVGTYGAGLSKANASNRKFIHYRNDPSNPNSLPDNRVWAIYEGQSGELWVGTSGGLSRLDRDTGRWTVYTHDPNDPHSLSHNTVRSVYEDREGLLWVGTEGGLDTLNRETGRFIHYRHDPNDSNTLSSNHIGPIYQDQEGDLWVGTSDAGLNRFDRATGRFQRYEADPGNPFSLSHNDVTSILQSYDGTLWIGTLGGGLNRFNRENERFYPYRHNPNDPYSLSSDMVFCICEDFRGRLFLGTWGAGFDRFDPRGRRFIHYRENDGLPNDVVYGIAEDQTGYLWISTNRGLARFDPSFGTFRNYDVSDGLQSNEFNPGAHYVNNTGELFFGGINGFNAFYPPKVEDNPHVPPVVITSFKKFDRIILTDISEDLAIELSYNDNFIAFEFASLDYTAPHKNQYTYRLEGFDPRWVDAGTRRYQSYSNLEGGDYVFRVKGSNNDGVWNRDGIAIYIKVIPPIWDRWWFRAVLALVLIGSALAGYRLRVRNIQTRTRELEAQVDERTYEIERRRVVAEGLREILVMLNSNRSLKESLDYIASQAAVLTGARRAFVFKREDDDPDPVVLGAYRRVGRSPRDDGLMPAVREWMLGGMQDGEPLILPSLPPCGGAAGNGHSPPSEKPCAVLAVPLTVTGEMYGGLALIYPEQREFSAEDIELGFTLVDQAALAIANAQLRDRMEHMAAETERSRLARDLHDAVTQTLFSASLIAEVLPATWASDQKEGRHLLTELRQLSRGAMAEMRTLLLELRPAALIEARFGDLLRQLAEAVTGRTGLPVHLQVEGQCTLPDEVHVSLYRIAQEALNNVMKHAHASQVKVSLRCTALPFRVENHQAHEVVLQVSDDGRGFDPKGASPDRLGLGIIRERAESIGARLHVESEPGAGTTVTAIWKG